MMVIDNKHEIGDTVFLKTDTEQSPRLVVSLQIYTAGELLYELACGTSKSYHYDFEINKEKDLKMAIDA